MLLNGAEGIGTGFSSVIPSFHHSDLIQSIIQFVETGKAKKLRSYVHNYKNKIHMDEKGRFVFSMNIEEINGSIYITELPRGYDATKIYRYLTKYIEEDYIKDFIDSSVNNDIKIELIFKKGQQPKVGYSEAFCFNNFSSKLHIDFRARCAHF